MRVLRIAHHGVTRAWRRREHELRALGLDVRLVSAARWDSGGRVLGFEADAGADAAAVPARTLGTHPSVFVYDPRPLWRALGERPDIIDIHEEPNALATAEILFLRWLRRSRAPYLLYSAQNIPKRYPVPFCWFERASLTAAAAAYVCNSAAGQILTTKGLKGPAELIPLGVDIDAFRPQSRAEPPGDLPLVGYVGRLETHKGVGVLLEAVAARPRWRAVIVGDGSERAALEARSRELQIAERVDFIGFATGERLAELYRSMDVLAVPSLTRPNWVEQFGRVAVEAMASGVPVVASASGVLRDVVADVGILVEEGSPAALAAGLDRAVEPARWALSRARGIARAQDFSWRAVAEQHAALYRKVLHPDAEADADLVHPVVALVVAYGPPGKLADCLESLGDRIPVTVVDNSSDARTREVAERFGAQYADAGSNLGFAAGVNLGLRGLFGDGPIDRDVLLLNPDARVSDGDVERMHGELHGCATLAAVGATQRVPQSGGEVRVWWPFPSPGGAWTEAIGLGRVRRRHDFAIGSVLLLRAQALRDVGPFDERFFLYSEETDWQRRARRRGWGISVVPTEATHEQGGTGGDPGIRETNFHASGELYIRKHFGRWGWGSYRAATVLGSAVRGVLLPSRSRRAAARRRRDLYLRGPVRVLREQRERGV